MKRTSTQANYTVLASLTFLLAVTSTAQASDKDLSPDAILNMSLTDLANQEVTSVSKKAEKASEAAAAVFVINQEDIKRSGATSIPEVLRMAPGISVAQAGAHDWAVTSRGFNGQFANKLLVLVDGRTIYSPLFSGVIWEVQDTLLEDIERIEVIRGPGATVWGANAVNGVINIITKNTKDTQGGLVTASAGNMIKSSDGGRYGIKIGDDSYARAYAKYDDNNEQYNVGTGRSGDGWQKRQAGFRSDSKLTAQDSLTVQGDLYEAVEGVRYNFPSLTAPYITQSAENINSSGGNVLARWTSKISPVSSTSTQFYIDNTQRKASYISYNTTTTDFDFQHTWTGWERNEVVWGAGYRRIADSDNRPTAFLSLTPTQRTDNLYSAFLQDKITLNPNDLFLTLGSKFEHNAYSGFEVQPSARVSWLISDTQMVWSSVSRAVHTPSRFTADGQLALAVVPPTLFVPGITDPTQLTNIGNKGLDSEELIAYEIGYRIQPTQKMSVDISTFYNDYSKLFTGTFGTGTFIAGPTFFQPLFASNNTTASSLGYEVSTKIDVTRNWQVAGSYSYIDLIFDPKGDPAFSYANNPKHQFNIRSTYLFPYNIEMTNALYYVDTLSAVNIPSYYRFDTKLSYEIMKGVEASLVGQNLLAHQHKEFSNFFYQNSTEIGRSIYGNVTFRF